MRVLFCGGGTAGHVNPAIAVAQTIMRNDPESKIAYVSTINGIENSLVDFKKYYVDVCGFNKIFTLKNISALKKMIHAMKQCREIVNEFRPDIIFGTGGYATFPVVYAGSKMGIKTVVHESNVLPGKAIKHLEKKVNKIFLNFEESINYFNSKEKVLVTGNPMRKYIEAESIPEAKRKLNLSYDRIILCTGGSLGAKRINDTAFEIIDNYIKYNKNVCFVWSTGKKEYTEIENKLRKKGLHNLENIIVSDYLFNMLDYMAAADLVISRAGAMSISELAYMGKSVILVPSPNVANNHQYLNAKALEKSNAAILVTEDRLYTLPDLVKSLINEEHKLRELSSNIMKYAKKDANRIIYNELSRLNK